MSETASYQLGMFSKHVGQTFRLRHDSGVCELALVEAAPRNEADGDEARNFSIVFHDPAASADSYLPQAIYRCEHDVLGALDLFLVPIGPGTDGQGIEYEAVFASRN